MYMGVENRLKFKYHSVMLINNPGSITVHSIDTYILHISWPVEIMTSTQKETLRAGCLKTRNSPYFHVNLNA
jgi:hypothetical protein